MAENPVVVQFDNFYSNFLLGALCGNLCDLCDKGLINHKAHRVEDTKGTKKAKLNYHPDLRL